MNDGEYYLKEKLTIEGIIENIKSKGITFKHVSEESAKEYLLTHTYYFKLKAYSKNYVKNPVRGKYIQLDFSYLKDLARLDMYFRELIFKMSVDIERFVKVQIMAECQRNDSDDGYTVVHDFLARNTGGREIELLTIRKIQHTMYVLNLNIDICSVKG